MYLAVEDIDHTRAKTKSPQTNGICERVHHTVLDEFYRVAFRGSSRADRQDARRGRDRLDHPIHLPQDSAGWMLMSYGGSVLGGWGSGEARRLILPTHSAHPCFANPQPPPPASTRSGARKTYNVEIRAAGSLRASRRGWVMHSPLYYHSQAGIARRLASKATNECLSEFLNETSKDYEDIALELEKSGVVESRHPDLVRQPR
jgi:hypothetical protein